MDFEMVPAAAPALKNQRATSWPAPISANVPYRTGSRLILSALSYVLSVGGSGSGLALIDVFIHGFSAGQEWKMMTKPGSCCRSVVDPDSAAALPHCAPDSGAAPPRTVQA